MITSIYLSLTNITGNVTGIASTLAQLMADINVCIVFTAPHLSYCGASYNTTSSSWDDQGVLSLD